jgi:hypothetical protein
MTDAGNPPDAAEIAARSARFRRLCEMMNERIRNMTNRDRYEIIQFFRAEAMKPTQYLRANFAMMDYIIAQRERQRERCNARP